MTDLEAATRPPTIFRRHLASNAMDEPDVLIALACDDSIIVRRAAATNPATPRWVIELLVRAGADPELRGRRTPDPEMDPDDLRRLVECGPWAQMLVVDHPNTSADVLDVLACQRSPNIRTSVAQHPRAGAITIGRLCADPEVDVRRTARDHPARPEAVYRLLRAAGADSTLDDVEHLSVQSDPTVLRAAATVGSWGGLLASRHPCCPSDVLEEVATFADWRLRSGILENPRAADALIARAADLDDLTASPSEAVDELRVIGDASATTAAIGAVAGHPRPVVRLAVARHRSVDRHLAATLAADGSAEIRRIVSRNPRIDHADLEVLIRAGSTPDLMHLADPDPELPPDALDRLASGGHWARQLAVRHPATLPTTLARLLCDDDGKLREWAAAHPSAPRDVIADIRRAGGADDFQGIAAPDANVSPEVLRRIAALGPWGAMIVSWHPNAPADLARSS